MTEAIRDQNRVTATLGVSSNDATVTLPIQVDPATGRLLVDNTTGGDVVGPSSATDNAIVRFDTTTGKLIQNSVVTIADTTGNMAGVGTLGCGAITTSGTLAMGANDITTTGAIGRDTDNEINWGTDDSLAIVIGGVTHNIVSITDGAGDNDKLVTQGYVDDAITAEDFWDRAATTLSPSNANDNIDMGSGNILTTGDVGATGSRITKGWLTDLEVTNAIAGSITGNAATVTGFTPASGSLTLSGADALTLTTTASTNVTLPTTGTLMANLSEDTTPQLGGNLDVNSNSIVSTSNGDITLAPNGTGIVKGELKRFMVQLYDSATDLATDTTIQGDFRISNRAITVKAVGAYVDTAAAAGSDLLTIDINEAGTTILSTKITIDVGEKTSETAATAPVISDSAIAADGIITIDIDQVNETTPAKGLKVWVDYIYA